MSLLDHPVLYKDKKQLLLFLNNTSDENLTIAFFNTSLCERL
jgi:hypothetical protein